MKPSKTILVNQKGMITLPIEIRKKHNLRPGSEVAVLELEGNIVIIPIKDIKSSRNIPLKEIMKSIDDARDEDLRLEG